MKQICLYESIADEFPIGVWRSDSDGKLIFINKKLKKYFNDSILGSNFINLIPQEKDRNDFLLSWEPEGTTIFEFYDPKNTKWYRMQIHKVENYYIGLTDNITSEKTLIPQLLMLKEDKGVF